MHFHFCRLKERRKVLVAKKSDVLEDGIGDPTVADASDSVLNFALVDAVLDEALAKVPAERVGGTLPSTCKVALAMMLEMWRIAYSAKEVAGDIELKLYEELEKRSLEERWLAKLEKDADLIVRYAASL